VTVTVNQIGTVLRHGPHSLDQGRAQHSQSPMDAVMTKGYLHLYGASVA
jgi:hypothetical protein